MVRTIFLLAFTYLALSCASVSLNEDRIKFNKVKYFSNVQFDFINPLLITQLPTPIDLDEQCHGKKWKSVTVSGLFWIFFPDSFNATLIGVKCGRPKSQIQS